MYTKRSKEKEILDLDDSHYTADEYQRCMKKLFTVNRVFGFWRDTVQILKRQPKNSSLIDIGCGSGLFLLNLGRRFPQMKLLGVDINPAAIQLAQQESQLWQQKNRTNTVTFKLHSQNNEEFSENNVDIVLATLVCHHIEDEALISFFQNTLRLARRLVILNDLQRSLLSQWLYRFISPLLFRNKLITHDGLISIKRGFTRKEWQLLLTKAGITNYQLKWRFPFRWQLVLWKE